MSLPSNSSREAWGPATWGAVTSSALHSSFVHRRLSMESAAAVGHGSWVAIFEQGPGRGFGQVCAGGSGVNQTVESLPTSRSLNRCANLRRPRRGTVAVSLVPGITIRWCGRWQAGLVSSAAAAAPHT